MIRYSADGRKTDYIHRCMTRPPTSPPATQPDSAPAPAEPSRHAFAADASLISTLVHLWPYIWPGDRLDLKMRVMWSVVLLLIAKLATLATPFTFKWAVDALNGNGTAPIQESNWPLWLFASPLLLTASYGFVRVLMAVVTQWRDGIFAKVAMHAVRQLAYKTFVHMHELSLRFHLERKTGGLTRVLERGRNGIETIVRMVILNMLPTLVEVILICGVLLWHFDWRYVLVILATVAAYMGFTYRATEWRIEIRRRMNESDSDANTKAIDSLLNYETVKYFGAEEREAQRYDKSMERYERASVHTYTSLAALNAGQAVVFTLGLGAVMALCAIGVRNGTHTVGDFVLINAMMIQLYVPLNIIGFVYREMKQAIIDIEKMFDVLHRRPEVEDRPGAKPLRVMSGAIRFEDVRFSYDAERPILKGLSFEVPAGKTVAIVGPSGAGKSTISRLLFRLRHSGWQDLDRWAGHSRRHADLVACGNWHGAAGYRALQRYHSLQYPLRAMGRERRGGRRGREDSSDRRVHSPLAEGLRDRGGRTRSQTLRRREAACGDRPDRAEGAVDPCFGRSYLSARQSHRA